MKKYAVPRPVIVLGKKVAIKDLQRIITRFKREGIEKICIISEVFLSFSLGLRNIIISDGRFLCQEYSNEEIIRHCAVIITHDDFLPMLKEVSGPRIPISSLSEDEFSRIVKLARIFQTYNKLPGIDCGRCRYKTCIGLARAIEEKVAGYDECIILSRSKKLVIRVGENMIYLNPWVEELYRRVIEDLLNALKGVKIRESDIIEIQVKKISNP